MVIAITIASATANVMSADLKDPCPCRHGDAPCCASHQRVLQSPPSQATTPCEAGMVWSILLFILSVLGCKPCDMSASES